MNYPLSPVYSGVLLAVHGGAGALDRETLGADFDAACRTAMATALREGYTLLMQGGTALDAVEAVVHFLEDAPVFNAGRGSAFTHDGTHELDASIMDGATGRAGAIAGVTTVRNPVALARAVMERSPFVLIAGSGADAYAELLGMEPVPNGFFATPHRQAQWEAARLAELRVAAAAPEEKYGTVGATARDLSGNLAAATSTGGMNNKRHGRIGDSPLVGAGVWADNTTCALSATGHGEYFIRAVACHDIHARMCYGGLSLQQAASAVVLEKLAKAGGSGGVIGINARGEAVLPFNSAGMYRGIVTEAGEIRVGIYREELEVFGSVSPSAPGTDERPEKPASAASVST